MWETLTSSVCMQNYIWSYVISWFYIDVFVQYGVGGSAHEHVSAHQGMCVKDRGQLTGGSSLLTHGILRLNSVRLSSKHLYPLGQLVGPPDLKKPVPSKESKRALFPGCRSWGPSCHVFSGCPSIGDCTMNIFLHKGVEKYHPLPSVNSLPGRGQQVSSQKLSLQQGSPWAPRQLWSVWSFHKHRGRGGLGF